MAALIEVNHLHKSYGSFKAVDNLSFSVDKGDVYGFLGQNGAGKSTTIRMLLTLIHPDSGNISIFGKSLSQHRNDILSGIGAIIEKPDLYKYLTALEHLRLFAAMSKCRISEGQMLEKLELVGLTDRKNSKAGTFSQGMKQRLGIAIALVHDPELIILDEPTNGLDPQGIADMRNLILRLSQEMSKTILVSSHLLSEIEQVANRMIIIHKGKKIVEGRVSDLLSPEQTLVTLQTTDAPKSLSLLADAGLRISIQESANHEIIRMMMNPADIPAMVSYLTGKDVGICSLTHKHSLEDYFIRLTQNH